MTTGSRRRIAALVAKEAAELRAATGVLLGPVAMLVMAVALPLVVAIGVPAWSGETIDAADAVLAGTGRLPLPGADRLPPAALLQAFLLHQFLPLLALVPVIGATTMVTTSVVGEKQARTLEPLLATPITIAELLLAKTGAALAVALTLLVVGCAALAGLAAALALPGVLATLASGRVLALLAGVAPAATLVALALGAIVSTRAKDARSAQQVGVVVVLPLVAGFVAQLNGPFFLDTSTLVMVTAGLLALAAALGALAVRLFDRERILTDWT